jgi:hypothetical protein
VLLRESAVREESIRNATQTISSRIHCLVRNPPSAPVPSCRQPLGSRAPWRVTADRTVLHFPLEHGYSSFPRFLTTRL